jgi:hypothetical protein
MLARVELASSSEKNLEYETEGEEREENSTERQLRDSDTNGCIPTNEGGVLGADSQYRVFLHLY